MKVLNEAVSNIVIQEGYDTFPEGPPPHGFLNGKLITNLTEIISRLKGVNKQNLLIKSVCSPAAIGSFSSGMIVNACLLPILFLDYFLLRVMIEKSTTTVVIEGTSTITGTSDWNKYDTNNLGIIFTAIYMNAVIFGGLCLAGGFIIVAGFIACWKTGKTVSLCKKINRQVQNGKEHAAALEQLGKNEVPVTVEDIKKYVKLVRSVISICRWQRGSNSAFFMSEQQETNRDIQDGFSDLMSYEQLVGYFSKLKKQKYQSHLFEFLTKEKGQVLRVLTNQCPEDAPFTLIHALKFLQENHVFQKEPGLTDYFMGLQSERLANNPIVLKALEGCKKEIDLDHHAPLISSSDIGSDIVIVVGDLRIPVREDKLHQCGVFRARMEHSWSDSVKDKGGNQGKEIIMKDVENPKLFLKMLDVLNTGTMEMSLDETVDLLLYSNSLCAIPVIAFCQWRILNMIQTPIGLQGDWETYFKHILKTVPASFMIEQKVCEFYDNVCQSAVKRNDWEAVRGRLVFAVNHPQFLEKSLSAFNPVLPTRDIKDIHIQIAFECEKTAFSNKIKQYYAWKIAKKTSPGKLLKNYKDYGSDKFLKLFYDFLISETAKNICNENFRDIWEYATREDEKPLLEACFDYVKTNNKEIFSLWDPGDIPNALAECRYSEAFSP